MHKDEKRDGWYKKKGYPHFDYPLSFEKALKIVADPEQVAKHSFYPFLAYTKKERKLKRVMKRGKTSNKEREIRYASHVDGYIYAYYAKQLSQKYEDELNKLGLTNNVLAYRKDIGSNIDFFDAAKSEIGKRKTCVALTCDISGFYDSLDHNHLKEQWCRVLGTKSLPADHYNIFKSITRYSRVDRDECYEALGEEKHSKKNSKLKSPPNPLCATPLEFRIKIRSAGLIKPANRDFGIPQGSPISACLSNIYMIPFDIIMQKAAERIGGYYRRYSDDILWIFEEQHLEKLNEFLTNEIKKAGEKLEINPSKTTITHFQEMPDGSITAKGSIFQYLGFTFDGANVHIRSGTMSKYYRKATFGIRRARKHARDAAENGGSSDIFKRKVYRQYTHLGRRNFLSYAKFSQNIMKSESIKKQVGRHWRVIQKKLNPPTEDKP